MSINSFSKEDLQTIWNLAREHLLKFEGVNDAIINEHFDDYKKGQRKSITGNDGLYNRLIVSIRNQRAVPRIIPSNKEFDIFKILPDLLFDYNPQDVIKNFTSADNFGENLRGKLPNRLRDEYKLDNNRNTWVKFAKGIYTGANFLSKFNNDILKWHEFVKIFSANEYSRLALPLLLAKEIHFMGFALACDFLKETGNCEYVKADIHLIKIFNGLKLSDNENPYTVFKDIIVFAEKIEEIPYCVDKAFWLIGSGIFYLYSKKKKTHSLGQNPRETFINFVNHQIKLT